MSPLESILALTLLIAVVAFTPLGILVFLEAFRAQKRRPEQDQALSSRVRQSLDAIVGGVVIVNESGKILFANESFARCVNSNARWLEGVELGSLPWSAENDAEWPWNCVLREGTPNTAVKLLMRHGPGKESSFIVNAAPFFDDNDQPMGVLISFENISVIESQRRELLQTLQALEVYQEQIRGQNRILHELANRDSLTGVYNRRALFDNFEKSWTAAPSGSEGLVTILLDVDHFKRLNDTHGHAVGDSVLKDVVVVLQDIVGARGFLARYGGEEFCVALQSATVDEGVQLAERIRGAIEECLREPYGVTASFGVSGNQLGGKSFQAQLQQADQGLYASKRSGRNTVRCWSESLAHHMRDVERRALDRMQHVVVEEHPISYHAMVALCSAVAHRHPGLAAHSQRVAEMAVALGRGSMDVEQLYVLEIAAMLHEVGCLAESEALTDDHSQALWSRFRLTQMRARNRSGLELLRSCMHSDALLETIEFQWHRFAATEGQKRSCEDLPLGARILAVANAYDELTSTEFGRGWSHDDAVAHLRSMSGRELDPEWVERFIDRMVGWRPSGPIAMASIDGQQAVMLGYQLERVLQGFQGRNASQLKTRLQSLDQIAQGLQFAPMLRLLERLSEEVERRSTSDWSSLLPWIEDLLELGMMVQREFLRSENVFSPRGFVASRV